MIPRYEDPSTRNIFSLKHKYDLWRSIELTYLRARLNSGDTSVTRDLIQRAMSHPMPELETIEHMERVHGHDVVAFLAAWTINMEPDVAAQIHRGLTSSDLVDNTLFIQVDDARLHMIRGIAAVNNRILDLADKYDKDRRPGRTHGQLAEPSTFGWRFRVWARTGSWLHESGSELAYATRVWKSPGAVGTARLLGMRVGETAALMHDRAYVPCTQVIPRQRLVAWAAWAVQITSWIEDIAMEVRLSARSEVGEMREGKAKSRTGSSAMPHKQNPIGAERLSGLGRVARGYLAPIMETAGNLHNDRDISNSSVERIVVPDLAHLVAQMLFEVYELLDLLEIDPGQGVRNWNQLDTAWVQFQLQGLGLPYMVAAEEARLWARDSGWDYARILTTVNSFNEEHPYTLDDFLSAVAPA